jgi:hypothetical protein
VPLPATMPYSPCTHIHTHTHTHTHPFSNPSERNKLTWCAWCGRNSLTKEPYSDLTVCILVVLIRQNHPVVGAGYIWKGRGVLWSGDREILCYQNHSGSAKIPGCQQDRGTSFENTEAARPTECKVGPGKPSTEGGKISQRLLANAVYHRYIFPTDTITIFLLLYPS